MKFCDYICRIRKSKKPFHIWYISDMAREVHLLASKWALSIHILGQSGWDECVQKSSERIAWLALCLFDIHLCFLYVAHVCRLIHWPLTRYATLRVAHAPGMSGTVSPPPRVSDPDMHHGTCVTHAPWCMPGSLTSVFFFKSVAEKTFPAFPAHAHPAILRIWLEAHWR